jgi:uncharacterized OB-fold protein
MATLFIETLYDSPPREADDQNPASLRYEFRGLSGAGVCGSMTLSNRLASSLRVGRTGTAEEPAQAAIALLEIHLSPEVF